MFNKIGEGLTAAKKKIRGDPEAAKAYLEEFEKFEYVHPHDGVPSLGAKAGITLKQEQSLYVTEKLFAHNRVLSDKVFAHAKCKDTIKVVYEELGAAAVSEENKAGASEAKSSSSSKKKKKKKQVIIIKTANMNNRVILCNQEGDVMAVLVQEIHLNTQSYGIYGSDPIFKNQRPSSQYHHEGKALFCWARITTLNKMPKHLSMDVNSSQGFEFEFLKMEPLDLGGVLAEKPILVKQKDKPAAVLRQGQFPDGIITPAWSVHLAAGVDPLLLVGLIAVMDAQSI